VKKSNRFLMKAVAVEKFDYEYERKGMASVFVVFEPLTGKRLVITARNRQPDEFDSGTRRRHHYDQRFFQRRKLVPRGPRDDHRSLAVFSRLILKKRRRPATTDALSRAV
jgi:hypothetical protein